MAEIIMPKMGDAMTEGKVVRWYKKTGDEVKKGEPVLEIETDKVNLDLEAEADGTLSELAAQEGEVVQVGGLLAEILGAGEKPTPRKKEEEPEDKEARKEEKPEPKKKEKKEAKEEPEARGPRPEASPQDQRRTTDKKDAFRHSTGEYGETMEMKGPRVDRTRASGGNVVAMPKSGERRRSSPLARNLARELGVDLESVEGSGPGGRIIAADVKNFKGGGARASSPAPMARAPQLEEKEVPLSAMRRTIAKRLAESTGPIPHFYLTVDYDVTDLLSIRQQLIEIEGVKVSVNDFIVRGAALALRHHPNVNARWGDEAITQHGAVHIGIAVATPEGLITPVIRNADQKSVSDIAQEVRALAEKAKNRKLKPDEYQGSTFTISNLGAWGIEEFTAIINPPNAAILAIGAAEARAVVIDRQVVIRDRMKVTMSCDHRIVDGAAGADYLKTLRAYIEQPLRLVV
ncbi:MAG TPA: dihydrolipoamide acetyltransferase family protein [Thermoanaerobaculia bacterium]|nr:dihydrolipoamide acetyltransferase family protein [Thermoanaerobaculia bacterium]